MFRVITANLNGIRAAQRKGFFEWMKRQKADVICIQETKAQEHQLDNAIFYPRGYHTYFFDAQKKGYSGVAIMSRHQPDKVSIGLGWDHVDSEGRWIEIELGKLTVASLYLPSGASSEERHNNKLIFMDRFAEDLKAMRRRRRDYIICGDFNTVHKEIDIKNWKSNQKTSGVTPVERAWLDNLFDNIGFIDAFREINQKPDQYTWWSNRGNARENNVGWRIDYQIITPGLKSSVKKASVYKNKWFSDHAPLTIDYDIDIRDL